MLQCPLPFREFVELQIDSNLTSTSGVIDIQYIGDRLHNILGCFMTKASSL